jgi:hypothetical protein
MARATLTASNREHWGHRLNRLLIDARMSQSQLARLVWGETTTDSRGYDRVVGKDRISVFINHGRVPRTWVIEKIAKIFKVDPEDLCPEAFDKATPAQIPALRIETLDGREDRVLLRVNRVVPGEIAAKIYALIMSADKENAFHSRGDRGPRRLEKPKTAK